MKRAVRVLGRIAYGLSPRWLAAIIVAFDALHEAREASARQAAK